MAKACLGVAATGMALPWDPPGLGVENALGLGA